MWKCDESPETGGDKQKTEPGSRVNLMLGLHDAGNKEKSYCSIWKHCSEEQSEIISLLSHTVNQSRKQKFISSREEKHEDCNMCISQHMFAPTLMLPWGASQLAALPETQEESRSIWIQQAGSQRSREDSQNSIDKQKVGNMQLWATLGSRVTEYNGNQTTLLLGLGNDIMLQSRNKFECNQPVASFFGAKLAFWPAGCYKMKDECPKWKGCIQLFLFSYVNFSNSVKKENELLVFAEIIIIFQVLFSFLWRFL